MQLPDINFWLALAFQSHEHHASAKAWMQSAAEQSCCFCRLTKQGFLRLATNRKIFPLKAVSMRDAWGVYDGLLSDTNPDSEGCQRSRLIMQPTAAITDKHKFTQIISQLSICVHPRPSVVKTFIVDMTWTDTKLLTPCLTRRHQLMQSVTEHFPCASDAGG